MSFSTPNGKRVEQGGDLEYMSETLGKAFGPDNESKSRCAKVWQWFETRSAAAVLGGCSNAKEDHETQEAFSHKQINTFELVKYRAGRIQKSQSNNRNRRPFALLTPPTLSVLSRIVYLAFEQADRMYIYTGRPAICITGYPYASVCYRSRDFGVVKMFVCTR